MTRTLPSNSNPPSTCAMKPGSRALEAEAEGLAQDKGAAVAELRGQLHRQAALGIPGRYCRARLQRVVVVRGGVKSHIHLAGRLLVGRFRVADLHLAGFRRCRLSPRP